MGFSAINNVYHFSGPSPVLRATPVVRATIGAIASPAAAPTIARDLVSLSPRNDVAFALANIGATLDAPARISNTLATADRALSRIGGLLGDVHSTLSANPSANQPSIDSNIKSIGQLAASTQFAGKPLLNGTFSTSLNGTTLSIPSFATTTLGLSDLTGDTIKSTAIVTAALAQVTTTRTLIDAFKSTAIRSTADAGQSALEQLVESPNLDGNSSASTTALLLRAKTLLSPAEAAGTSQSQARSVLALLS